MPGTTSRNSHSEIPGRIMAPLCYGLFMFASVNISVFLHQQQRLAETKEIIWLSISFLMWAGGSVALGEWHYRRLMRQEEEDQ